MITFKALGNTYTYPEDLSEVTLRKFIEYCEYEKKYRPEKLKELSKVKGELADIPESDRLDRKAFEKKVSLLLDDINDPNYFEVMISWYARVISFWTGLPYNIIMGEDGGEGMNLKHLELLSEKLLILVSRLPEVEYSNVIEYKGDIWYLGERFMKDATVTTYLESSQLYKIEEAFAGGQWGALAKAVCILLRKKGENYNRTLLDREEYFLDLPMTKAHQVSFFFKRQTQLYSTLLSIYTASQVNAKLKQGLGN